MADQHQPYRIFLRHFDKEPHDFRPLEHFARIAARNPAELALYVSNWNAHDRERVGLSEAGRMQAARMRRVLPGFLAELGADVRHLIVSPYRRTEESALQLLKCFPQVQELKPEESLRELNPGVQCAQRRWTAVWRALPEYRALVQERGFLNVPIPFGESLASRRDGDIAGFLQRIAAEPDDVFCVTHNGVMDCVHQLAHGLSDEAVVERLAYQPERIPYGTLHIYRQDPATGALLPEREVTLPCAPS